MKWKAKGFAVATAALTAVVFMLLASSIAGIYSGMFSMLGSSRTAVAAAQYAEIDANTLTLLPYDALNSAGHGRMNIAGAEGWQSEVEIGPEKIIGLDGRQRIGTVKIYKDGENAARSSLQVPLSSKGSAAQVPGGTILPWYGSITSIPKGFSYCDGTNGTPDLRGRTLIGTGLWNDYFSSVNYSLGEMSGERVHQLSVSELPAHAISFTLYPSHGKSGMIGRPGWSDGDSSKYRWEKQTVRSDVIGANQPHNNMMPYMAVHWIMKI